MENIKMEKFCNIPLLIHWEAFVESNNCVIIKINEELNIEESRVILKGKDRESLMDIKINCHDIKVCIPSGNPIFVELHTNFGVSVRYVKGSGHELYKKLNIEYGKN